jgi:hypothetical protein
MSFQPLRVRNLDAAQNQFSSLGEAMHVVPNPTANNHEKNDETRMPNDEANSNVESRNAWTVIRCLSS